ncbi:MAG: hypothetical protein ACXVCY_08785 [Pseudobdellovibrionaceae bacterium]
MKNVFIVMMLIIGGHLEANAGSKVVINASCRYVCVVGSEDVEPADAQSIGGTRDITEIVYQGFSGISHSQFDKISTHEYGSELCKKKFGKSSKIDSESISCLSTVVTEP